MGQGRCHAGKKLSLLDSVGSRKERLACRLPEKKSASSLCHQKAWTRPGGPLSLLIIYVEYLKLCKAEQQGVSWKSITFSNNSAEIKNLNSPERMSHYLHPCRRGTRASKTDRGVATFHPGSDTWHNHREDHRSVQIIARRRGRSPTSLGKCSNSFPSRSLCCRKAK